MHHDLHEPSLNALVGAFIKATREGKAEFTIPIVHVDNWDKRRIHASDLGKCPREVSHRYHGDEERDKSPAELDGELRMFFVAYGLHNLVTNALAWDNRLIEEEVDLSPWMPEDMIGAADQLWINWDEEPEVLDEKSQHPNWRTYISDYPKLHHTLQVGIYNLALCERHASDPAKHFCPTGCRLYYLGRGDKTRGEEFPFSPDHAAIATQVQLMKWASETNASLIDPLPKVIKKVGGAHSFSKITFGPDWRCTYCDFCGVSCVPHDMKSNALLYKDPDKNWRISKLGKLMADEVLKATGIDFAHLDALEDMASQPDRGWVEAE